MRTCGLSPFYFNILSLLHVQKAAQNFQFYTFPETSFRGFIHHNFHIVHKICMRIVFTFSLEKAVIIKEIEGNLLMQNFLGVNKMFYGRCKNGEYVNNFFIIFVLLLFFNFTLQKMRDQHLARFLSFSVRSWIALRYCFLL